MELWDREYIDLVVPGFVEFRGQRMGEFQFGTVHGWIDYRASERDGQPAVEFSWEGQNDNDPGCGRGWAVLKDDRLEGRLFIHCGDDSWFIASKSMVAERGRAIRRPKPRHLTRP